MESLLSPIRVRTINRFKLIVLFTRALTDLLTDIVGSCHGSESSIT